ncbi:MAG: hypothetical protein LBT15_01265, partial [Synergistaceae bacterium]|nr:hypothetical protein [Synergistaceae bacterium]
PVADARIPVDPSALAITYWGQGVHDPLWGLRRRPKRRLHSQKFLSVKRSGLINGLIRFFPPSALFAFTEQLNVVETFSSAG